MRQDVEHALRIDLDHLGLYHLVLFRGLGTAWSRDPALLASLPTNEQAAEHWLALRQLLLERGFVQTTLTNFEQARYRGDDRRFVYEELSFQSDRIRHGRLRAGGDFFRRRPSFTSGLKVLNPDAAAAYVAAVRSGGSLFDRFFEYDPTDLRIFYLTRRLAALEIDRRAYARLFRTDPLADFASEFDVLLDEGLVEVTSTAIRPTPRGMFYADSIAAQFAWRQINAWRSRRAPRSLGVLGDHGREQQESVNNNSRGHM